MKPLKERALTLGISPCQLAWIEGDLPGAHDTFQAVLSLCRSAAPKIITGIMRSQGVSLRKMAKAMLCSPTYLSQVIHNKSAPSARFLILLAQFTREVK